MKAPVQTNSISDYLHEKVIEKAMELVKYNLNLYCELEEKCPFFAWKTDLQNLKQKTAGGLARLARVLAQHARGHRFEPYILYNKSIENK